MRSVFIAGCGYTGIKLAARWIAEGAGVLGSATRPERLTLIAGTGARALPLDMDRPIEPIDGSDDSLTSYLHREATWSRSPPPPLIGRAEAHAWLPGSAWSFLGESRRVDNRRMREELGVPLAYCDLDEGIRASL